jgi:hypothetical protein
MKKLVDTLDATPKKRIYQPIIADYGLRTGICELVDNSLDARIGSAAASPLTISIDIDSEESSITIIDNASGVAVDELDKLVSPGETSSVGLDGAIGFFGVGSKRAVVALAKDIKISTRHGTEKTYQVDVDDEWIGSDSWALAYYEVDDIMPSTTKIELNGLRVGTDAKGVEDLREHLGAVYGMFITAGEVEIQLDRVPVQARLFDQWSFPHDSDLHPTTYVREITDYKSGRKVVFEFTPGLTYDQEDVAEDFGLFVYCNKRLISRALKDAQIGFPRPHSDQTLARILVELVGPSDLMPWHSNKSGINYNHATFKEIRADIVKVVGQWAKISARLKPNFKEAVAPYKDGAINRVKLNAGQPVRLGKVPPAPNRKKSYKTEVISLNKGMVGVKPWIEGLYETVIAEEIISRQTSLTQQNRISLILLDSTIEIGCKEYLRHTVRLPPTWIAKLRRNELHDEVEKHVLTGDEIWGRFRQYYRFRNTFIHETADLSVKPKLIDQFRNDTKLFLTDAFRIKFP